MEWMDLLKSLIFWGPGAVLALAIIWALYKLADKHFGAFIIAQQSQAQSMEGLKISIQAFVSTDNGEHREMMVLLKYIAQHQQGLDEMRVEHAEMMSKEGACRRT